MDEDADRQLVIKAFNESLSIDPKQIKTFIRQRYKDDHGYPIDLPLSYIKNVIKNFEAKQVFGQKQENKDLQIPISAPLGSFQMDIMYYEREDYGKYVTKGYNYMLVIVEINTRFAYLYPLKKKDGRSILECLQDLQAKEGENLRSISCDAGKEFQNKLVEDYLAREGIEFLVFNKQEQPNATEIVERLIQTIRQKIAYFISNTGNPDYIGKNNANLKHILDVYNKNSVHSSIKMTPEQAKITNFSDQAARNEKIDKVDAVDSTFEIGDFVRIYRTRSDRGFFEKGRQYYTLEVYKIIGREGDRFKLQEYQDGEPLDKFETSTAAYLKKIDAQNLVRPTGPDVQSLEVQKAQKKQARSDRALQRKLKADGIQLDNVIDEPRVRVPARK